MKKRRDYSLSKDLLNDYMQSSLTNAKDLLTDATILLSQTRYARSYFLACASIEETGKAYYAFSALGRNLDNPGTVTKIKSSFQNHRNKIISAMICLLLKSEATKERTEEFLKLSLNLEIGREKSMYVDIDEKQQVTVPERIMRPIAAVDSVRLARSCFEATLEAIQNNNPPQSTASQYKFMCLDARKVASIFSSEDFWEFLIDHVRNKVAGFDHIEGCVKYHDEYYSKRRLYVKK